jgi:hypothetical protein
MLLPVFRANRVSVFFHHHHEQWLEAARWAWLDHLIDERMHVNGATFLSSLLIYMLVRDRFQGQMLDLCTSMVTSFSPSLLLYHTYGSYAC